MRQGPNDFEHRPNGITALTVFYKRQAMECLISTEDYPKVEPYHWCTHTAPKRRKKKFYVVAAIRKADCTWTTLCIHRLLMLGVKEVDHKNGDGLDNRRENLRAATDSQNSANAGKCACASTSRFKGVSWGKDRGKWRAYIEMNGRQKFLGYFHDELDAARAYNEAALEAFGEFARVNVLPPAEALEAGGANPQ